GRGRGHGGQHYDPHGARHQIGGVSAVADAELDHAVARRGCRGIEIAKLNRAQRSLVSRYRRRATHGQYARARVVGARNAALVNEPQAVARHEPAANRHRGPGQVGAVSIAHGERAGNRGVHLAGRVGQHARFNVGQHRRARQHRKHDPAARAAGRSHGYEA
nr:hypothetical protein [Tanacetum cinerariifolium]